MTKPKKNRKGDITWLKSRRCYNWHGLIDKYLLVFYSFTCDICQNEVTNYLTNSSSNSLRKKPTFCDATTGYPAKRNQYWRQEMSAVYSSYSSNHKAECIIYLGYIRGYYIERKYTGKKEGNLKLATNRMTNKINL